MPYAAQVETLAINIGRWLLYHRYGRHGMYFWLFLRLFVLILQRGQLDLQSWRGPFC